MNAAARLVCIMTVFALPAAAQDLESLQQGVRIRVEPVAGDRETGTYLGVDNDSLRFFREKTQSAASAFPVDQVKSLQVSSGRSRSRGLLKGALVGTAIGVLSGAILGAATYSDSGEIWCIVACSRSETAALAGVLLGTGGLVVGSVYGAMRGSEVWKPVPLNRR